MEKLTSWVPTTLPLKTQCRKHSLFRIAHKHMLNLRHTLDSHWHQGDLSRWLKFSTCLCAVLNRGGFKNMLKYFPELRSKSSLQFSKPSGMSSFSIIWGHTLPWHAVYVFTGFAWGRICLMGPIDFNGVTSGMILVHCGILFLSWFLWLELLKCNIKNFGKESCGTL